jgi:hypothetical protein
MPRICVVLLLVVLCGASQCLGEAKKGDTIIVRVTPAPQQPDPAPQAQQAVAQPTEARAPTPREQLYVFWILGRMLSYPLDRAESYIRGKLERRSQEPVAVPANASGPGNPFDSVAQREIPPAPPAVGGAAAERH